MLNSEIVKKIEDFVYAKPRSIQEIAVHIGKNWRTADRYVEEIEKDFGTISSRVFRGGTRGALKVVFWASVEKVSHSIFQEELEKQIFQGRKKEDFSAFDIFQHVPSKDKMLRIKSGKDENDSGRLFEFRNILMKAKKQVLFFSGNLSFINYNEGKVNIFSTLEELAKEGVYIKVVCRVDLGGLENVKKMLSLNHKYGKEIVEIRHKDQPLRASIIDKSTVSMKEIKEPTGRDHELNKKTFLFYDVSNKEWTEWLTKIFWKMFNSSVRAEKRLEELEKIKLA